MKAILIALLFFSTFACKPETKVAKATENAKPANAKTSETIEGEHNPPIEKSEVKEGHWYCDMGTVHYSRAEKGDGKCPLCKMILHEKKTQK